MRGGDESSMTNLRVVSDDDERAVKGFRHGEGDDDDDDVDHDDGDESLHHLFVVRPVLDVVRRGTGPAIIRPRFSLHRNPVQEVGPRNVRSLVLIRTQR